MKSPTDSHGLVDPSINSGSNKGPQLLMGQLLDLKGQTHYLANNKVDLLCCVKSTFLKALAVFFFLLACLVRGSGRSLLHTHKSHKVIFR